MMRLQCSLCLFVAAVVPATLRADTVQIYRKQLPDRQILTVTRAEVPEDKITPQRQAENAKWLKDNPGYSFGPASDHLYLYTFLLASVDGKRHQVLWTTRQGTFGVAPPPGQTREGSMAVEVLDVAVEKGTTLVVLYDQSNFIYANVIQPGPQGSRSQLTWRESGLGIPVSGLDGLIVKGEISGSLKNGNLTAGLTSYTGKTFVFRWQDHKWALDPAAVAPMTPNQPQPVKNG